MTNLLAAEIATVTARGTRVITICPGTADLANLPPNFMHRGRRHQAFTHSMRTAHKTVAAALATDNR